MHLFRERLLFSCGNDGYTGAAIVDSEPSREQRGRGTEAVADWLTLAGQHGLGCLVLEEASVLRGVMAKNVLFFFFFFNVFT